MLQASSLASVPTTKLFTKLNFFQHPKPGLVHWMPLGTAILKKITTLIHRHMQLVGAEEIRMSAVSPASLWQKTGRWVGTELFKLADSGGKEYCLAATCEEDITAVVAAQVTSYKSLPLLYYQINSKFRDEKRPRAGLLRGREFLMKDAYSFDVSPESAAETYAAMVETYHRVFRELRVPYVKAEACSGEIGGSLSHEWHYIHPLGADTLLTCSSCGLVLNVEKTLSHPNNASADAKNAHASAVAVRYFVNVGRNTLVCAYYPEHRTLLPNLVQQEIPDIDINCGLTQDQILKLFRDQDALFDKEILRVMDLRLHSRSNFPDFPIPFLNRSQIVTLTGVPIVEAQDGELCGLCMEGALVSSPAIEVGHTFFLGDKYSKPLGCTVDVPKADGRTETVNVEMGCYGIGISRLIAAIGEVNRDEMGFRWPACIAPWHVTVINAKAEGINTEHVMAALADAGIDSRYDDRDALGLGRKTKEARLVGIPLVVIVGRNYPTVEIEVGGKKYSELWKAEQLRVEGWEVEYSGDVDVKHRVHIDRLGEVVRVLLQDM